MELDSLGKFRELERQLSDEHGSFVFFALFLRDDAAGDWDLIVSAPWMSQDRQKAVEFLVDEIRSRMGEDQLVGLSRIVVLDPADPAVLAINRSIHVEHGEVEVREGIFFGVEVRHAHIITSRPSSPAAASA